MDDVAQLLAQAKACHGAGQLQQAERNYRRVLQIDCQNLEATFLLGTACHALGKLEDAATCFEQAARLKPSQAEFHDALGQVLAQQGKWDEAAECFRRALAVDPRFVPAHGNLGNALRSQGQLEQAAACYARVLALEPDSAQAHHDLGRIFHEQGRLEEAAASLRQALHLQPNHVEVYAGLANVLASQGKLDEAVACCRRALELRPDFGEMHNNLAVFLIQQGAFDEAEGCCRRAVNLRPDFVNAHNNLGIILAERNQFDEALACYRTALKINPNYAEGHFTCALTSLQIGRWDEAEACCRQALRLRPDFAKAHNILGVILTSQHRLDEALSSYRTALKLMPNDVEANFRYALALLQMGRFAEGWPRYEWRLKRPGAETTVSVPPWNGSPLDGRTILLRSEQGFGDTLQFVRYAELVKQQGGTVIVESHPPLIRLLAGCAGVDRVILAGETVRSVDVDAPLPSLPGIFHTDLDSIPARVPYLSPDAESVARWREELGHDRGLKIGIAWQGRPTNLGDRARSFPLARFAGIAAMRGVRLYSLQVGAGVEQLSAFAGAWPITDLGDRLGDFYNTAAIVSNLDLVITCDSAPAHLAGALGVRVWLALAYSCDWRWMLERTDSPWYPTMRLFRQSSPGDWDGVFERIEAAAAELARGTETKI